MFVVGLILGFFVGMLANDHYASSRWTKRFQDLNKELDECRKRRG